MYDRIKTIPTSRDAKMLFGIFAAFVARGMIATGSDLMDSNADGALLAFLGAGLMVGTAILAMVRYDTGRPLFEPLNKRG